MELSNNLKMRYDRVPDDAKPGVSVGHEEILDPNNAAQVEDAESQMRRALGLLGEAPRHRPETERNEPVHRPADRFGSSTHRRRFVQDGDVPVTVVRREGHDNATPRMPAPASPQLNNRLQRIEASLASEVAARERAERALADAQSMVRDLQTKIGHAELARAEAVTTLQKEREIVTQLRLEAAQVQDRLRQAAADEGAAKHSHQLALEKLALEQQARLQAEDALSQMQQPEQAELPMLHAPVDEAIEWIPPAPIVTVKRSAEAAAVSPAIRRRRAAAPISTEQEPVKWWLNVKPSPKRR